MIEQIHEECAYYRNGMCELEEIEWGYPYECCKPHSCMEFYKSNLNNEQRM